MKKLLEYLLVCTLLCAAIAGPSTAFADVCKVYGSQHQYTEEGYEALHPHKEYVKCKCGWADYTGGTRTLDDCAECSEDSGPAHTPDDPEDETCEHTSKVTTNSQIVDYQQLTSDLWPDYTDIAATHHAIIHTYTLQCTDCQKTFDPITELMCCAGHHCDNQGVCEECNYCTHKNINKEYLGEGTVTNKDDYHYHYIEMPYEGSCSYCGAVIDGIDEGYEPHEYNHDGWCFCGYYNEDYCPHDNTELRDAGYGYGVDGSIEETRHFTEHHYEEYCFDCDTIIGNGWADAGPHNPWWEGYWEDHDFGSDGYCVCGYYKEPEVCAHEKTDRRDVDTKYISIAGDTRNHTVEQVYETYCLACAQVLSTLQDSWPEVHQNNSDGLCTLCGYQIDPDAVTEPLKVSLTVWQKTAVIDTSIGVTATISGGSGDFRYQWSATSGQGTHAQSNSAKASWAITPKVADTWSFSLTLHDNVTGEKVTAYSGSTVVLSECQHTGKRLDYGKKLWAVTYSFDSEKDILRHLVIDNATAMWTCADCLQEVAGETQTSLNRKEVHTFDEETNKCVCGANRIDNFDGRLSYKLREMVEENWDPYGKWTHVYEHWDSVWANGALYINDRVVGLEFAQIAADAAATVWMATDFVAEMSHYAQYKELILAAHIFGLDPNIPTYESAVEQIRAEIASESGYLEAGITTKQLGVVANIVADSIRYAESATIEEYKAVNAEWLSHWDAVNSALDDDLLGITEWLTKKFPKAAKTLSANNKAGDILGNGITGAKVLIDIYETSLQAHLIDTFAQTHINYMQNALDSIGYDQRPLRMSLQTLINETCAQYDNSGFVGNIYIDSPDWTGSVETYLKQYTNLAKEETINIACEQIPGVGVAGLVFLGIDLATGNATKTDDLLAYKKAYEIAEGSHESLLSAIDALHDPLTQSQLDELETKIVFYASSCQTLSNYYNGLLEYTAKKGLPISTSNYSSEDFIEETSAYINLFKRIDKRQD